MAFDSMQIVQLLDSALKEYKKNHPDNKDMRIVTVSYDGDNKSCSLIVDVQELRRHNKSVAIQSFIISSADVEEIPYEKS